EAGRDYTYRVASVDLDGTRAYSQSVKVSRAVVASEFSLEQNYPNPFNPTTTIKFTLASDAQVTMRILDVTGKVVRTELSDAHMSAGMQEMTFDAKGLASGSYVYELNA